jgi:hypothetical protein
MIRWLCTGHDFKSRRFYAIRGNHHGDDWGNEKDFRGALGWGFVKGNDTVFNRGSRTMAEFALGVPRCWW